jgi:antitoxin component YwqK of YwqJK toxin-antitoxin module
MLDARLWGCMAAAILFATSGAFAAAPELIASGACRDGAPNGAYDLRMPDGRLRVLGAFAKGKRTGTFLFWSSTGSRIAVVPYDEDAKVGTVAVWFATPGRDGEPRRKLEAPHAANVRHGVTRSWHPNGRQRTEYLYERGSLVAARAWSESGTALPEAEARRLAERDTVADADFLAGLERMIAENGPRCD